MASKEYDFLVTLKSNTALIVNVISRLLLILGMCVFVYIGFRILPVSEKGAWKPFVVAAFIFLWMMVRFVASNKPYYRLALLVAGVYFFFSPMGFSWIGFLYIIAGLLEKQAKIPQELGLDKDGVTTNSIIAKHYNWSELSNVMIKDNLFTMDFMNNKLFQKELKNSISKEVEMEFNDFCKNCLKAAHPLF
ncbi:MAG TPA: hypothetical protein VGB84_03270 [Arachidicoccus sp.]